MIDPIAELAEPAPVVYVPFWVLARVKKNYVLEIDTHNFLQHLRALGFYKIFEDGQYTFVRESGGIIDEYVPQQVLDFAIAGMEKIIEHYKSLPGNIALAAAEADENTRPAKKLLSLLSRDAVERALLEHRRRFDELFLRFLPERVPAVVRDTRTRATILFAATAVEITADSITPVPYGTLPGAVWRRSLLDRDYSPADSTPGQFEQFVQLLCSHIGPGVGRDRPVTLDAPRYKSLCTALGYLLHTYKNSGESKSVILTEIISGQRAEGGTGKSLCVRALGKIRPTVNIDGKLKIFQDSHAWSAVDRSTKIVHIEDAERRFPYEQLFNLVTGDWSVNEKYGSKYVIDFDDSPKIILTTNYAIGGFSSSFRRRMHEVEVSRYFSAEYQPEDYFGGLFFEDWDTAEWARFDNFLIRCVQDYLRDGLTEYEKINIGERKLDLLLPDGFLDFARYKFKLGEKYVTAELLAEFHEMDGTRDLKPKRMRMAMEEYGQSKGWELLTKVAWNPATSKAQRVHVFVEKGSTADPTDPATEALIAAAVPDFSEKKGTGVSSNNSTNALNDPF